MQVGTSRKVVTETINSNTHRNRGPSILGDSISKTYRSVTTTYGESSGIPWWFSWREMNVFTVLFLPDQNHVLPSFNATCSSCKHLHAWEGTLATGKVCVFGSYVITLKGANACSQIMSRGHYHQTSNPMGISYDRRHAIKIETRTIMTDITTKPMYKMRQVSTGPKRQLCLGLFTESRMKYKVRNE